MGDTSIDDLSKQELIEQLEKLEKEMVAMEKLSSVGKLSAHIAHEINNPINFIQTSVPPLKANFETIVSLLAESLILLKEASDEKFKQIEMKKQDIEYDYILEESAELFEGIEDGANRMTHVVNSMRSYARAEDKLVQYDLHEGINTTVALLKTKCKERIEFDVELISISMITCVPGKIKQVLMNIIGNAVDAIKETGTITIRTSEIGSNIELKITDNGMGISDDIKEKIFQPFYTTKPVHGTGIGLSIVTKIINQHGGNIKVESEVGVGTTFSITLPIK